MIRKLALLGAGLSGMLFAGEAARQKVQISKTERIEFVMGGTLRLNNSTGELTVEGWDRPEVEITTVRSTTGEYSPEERAAEERRLERIHVTAHRDGNELTITTDYPGRHVVPVLLGSTPGFSLEYRIKAPLNTKLVAEHGVGEVHVDDLTGDINVTACEGAITLHLPEDGRYSVQAKSNLGGVISDFADQERRRFWLIGHRMETPDSAGTHKLNLRIGSGDILILKIRIPKTAQIGGAAAKADGA